MSSTVFAQKWEKQALPYSARIVHAMASNEKGNYILEGRLFDGGRSNQMIFIPREDKKSMVLKAPNSRDGHSLSSDDKGNLISFGGNSSKGVVNEFWYFENSDWNLIKTNNDALQPRWAHGSVFFNKKLWIFGGKGENSSQFYQDLWSWDGKALKCYESVIKPEPRYGLQLGVFDNKIVLYGGRNHSGDWFTDTWVWDNEWIKIDNSNTKENPRASVGCILITTKDNLFLIGGILKGDSYNEMWKFDGKKWVLLDDNLPFNLDFPAGCYDAIDNKLVITGTSKGSFEMWTYKLD